MKKSLLSLATALVLITVLAVPAFAATFNLSLTPDTLMETQGQWFADGTNSAGKVWDTKLPFEVLAGMTKVEVTMPELPDGEPLMIVMGGTGNWWTNVASTYADGKYTADMALASAVYTNAEEGGYFIIGGDEWVTPYGQLGITGIAITTTYSGGGGGGAAKGGDATMIALAVSALLLAAGATVVIARKVKA